MYRNYFTIGWRNLSRQKLYSAIKIGGFALGIATCLLIALFIRDELSYDLGITPVQTEYSGLSKVDDLVKDNGSNRMFELPFANALKNDFPEVENPDALTPANFLAREAMK